MIQVEGNGERLSNTAEVAPYQPAITIAARAEALRRLLGANIDENRQLTARVRRLEAELRRSSAEVAKLRGELRSAVQDALTDPLTGLANRRSFDLELRRIARGQVVTRAPRDGGHRSLQAGQDVHGHDIGDEVLRIVGEVLLAHVRRDSLVARVGGGEFGILLPGASPHYTAGIATRLCQLLASRPLVVQGRPEIIEPITLSIGLAAWHAGGSSARWFARADAALYEAKRAGR